MENLNAPQELSPSGSYFTVNLKKHGKVGFGFEITGGQEHGTQVVISRIVRLGPAEGCLQVGDEIQYVNEVKVIGATGDRVIMLVKNAELLGEVNLGIYRNLARMEDAMYVATSSTLPQQRYAPVELPNSSSKDPNYHYGIPAQRNSGTEAASDGLEESTAVKQKRKGSSKGMSVVVFKSGDVVIKGSTVIKPNTLEVAQIKKPHKGQFKTGVQISSTMTTAEVKTKLKEIFPILQGERFYCASNSIKEGKLKFYGAPSVWDGKSIRQRVTGNSALYVLIEDAGTKERISQGMQCSMPGTPQMNATALAPGEATLQSQNMPESRPLSRWSDPSDSVHRQCDRAEVDDWMASGPSPHEDLDIVYTYLHSESGKDDLPELQNFEDIEPMDTSQPMNTKPSGDESWSSDPSDSGHGQSDRVEERSQEEIPSVPSGACPPVRLEVREVESSVKKIVPDSSPLEGGKDFVLIMSEALPPNIESGFAFFGNVHVEVNRNGPILTGIVPPSQKPGIVTVTVQSTCGMPFGNILFEYFDPEENFLKQLVLDPKLRWKMFSRMADREQQLNLRPHHTDPTTGSSQASYVLATLVYAAAKFDAPELIRMIFDSTSGGVVFHAYKDRAKLPESVARDHGNDDTATYLEEVTTRFYEEIKSGKEFNQTVDWLELIKAADEAQANHDSEERDRNHLESNLVKESGYSADVESSPSLSSDSGGSDSERHTPISSYDGIDCKLLCKKCFPTENKMLSKMSRRLSDFSSYSKIWESNWQSRMRHWRLMSVVR